MSATGPENIFEKLRYLLLHHYEPASVAGFGTVTMTTMEIYERLQDFLPSSDYNEQTIRDILDSHGFNFVERGTLNFEWILKKKITIPS